MNRRRWLLALAWLVVAVIAWAMMWPAQQAVHGPAFATDFHKFLLSVEHFADTGDLYVSPGRGEAAALLHGNLNPPPFSLLILPFAPFGFAAGLALWQWLSLAGALLAVPLLWRIAAVPAGWRGGLFALALGLTIVAGYPALVVYNIGQVTFLLLPVLLLALLAIQEGRNVGGGVLLGLLCLLKPLFGLPVLLLLLLGEWRIVLAAITGGLALALTGTLIFGVDAWLAYLAVLGDVDWYGVSWNASLPGLLTRLNGGNGLPLSGQLVHLGLAVLLLGALWRAARRLPERGARLRLALAGALPLMLLLSPLGWMYYWSWCMPSVALLAPPLREAGRGAFVWWLLLPAVGVLRLTPLLPFPSGAEDFATIGGWSFYLLLTLALFALVLAAGRILAHSHRDQMVTSV
jgi:hypothetical protein